MVSVNNKAITEISNIGTSTKKITSKNHLVRNQNLPRQEQVSLDLQVVVIVLAVAFVEELVVVAAAALVEELVVVAAAAFVEELVVVAAAAFVEEHAVVALIVD